jgi:hypothetical protein
MPYFYNDKINILFIHIPKTGGTSVETYLSKKYDIELNEKSLFIYKKHFMNASYQHQLYINMKRNKAFFNINFNEIFMFSVVRNPYDRIVSDLFFLKIINDEMSIENITSKLYPLILKGSRHLHKPEKEKHFKEPKIKSGSSHLGVKPFFNSEILLISLLCSMI